jgi:hypothetical protein
MVADNDITKKKNPCKEQSDGQNTKHPQKFVNKVLSFESISHKCVNLRNKKLLATDTTVQVESMYWLQSTLYETKPS